MFRSIPVLLTLVLLTGCERSSTSPETVPFLHATVSGAFSADHRGGAEFWREIMNDTLRRRTIDSRGEGAIRGVSFQFLESSPSSFEPGVYPLSPRNFFEGHNDGNTGIFVSDGWDRYIAESGTLTITSASDDWVSGDFELTAVYWCNRYSDTEPCSALPDSFSPEAPRIVVHGQFTAEPADVVGWPKR